VGITDKEVSLNNKEDTLKAQLSDLNNINTAQSDIAKSVDKTTKREKKGEGKQIAPLPTLTMPTKLEGANQEDLLKEWHCRKRHLRLLERTQVQCRCYRQSTREYAQLVDKRRFNFSRS